MMAASPVFALAVFSFTVCATAVLARQDDAIRRAHQLDMQGDQPAAIALYREVLERDAASFDAHYGLGRALDLAGDYEEARRHFARALELAPDDLQDQTLRMMGISYVFTDDTARAAEYFERVYERDRAAGNMLGAGEVANELGRVYLEDGDTAQAERWYRAGRDAALAQPDAAPWLVDLTALRWAHAEARIAVRNGDFAAARRFAAEVKRLVDKGTNPDQQVQYEYLAGYIAYYAGEYEPAIEHLQRADQQDPFVTFLLAEAAGQLGRADRARELYEQTLASNSHAVNNAFVRRLAREKLQ